MGSIVESANLLDTVVDFVYEAGERILELYGVPSTVEEKEDRSPLTAADRAAHEHLVDRLSSFTPSIPLLSEESPQDAIAQRRNWERFWLVDPLDGTKEFIRGSGEFTVNVALIEGGRPVIGIVHVPALNTTYRASKDSGAEKAGEDGRFRRIRTRRFDSESPVLVGSRDHAGRGVGRLATSLGRGVRFTSLGSSLKFCLVAEGLADLYLRDRPTMEWDTGAAQCIVEQAGGGVFALDDSAPGARLKYNKDSLRNPHFLCVGDLDGPWRELSRSARTTE